MWVFFIGLVSLGVQRTGCSAGARRGAPRPAAAPADAGRGGQGMGPPRSSVRQRRCCLGKRCALRISGARGVGRKPYRRRRGALLLGQGLRCAGRTWAASSGTPRQTPMSSPASRGGTARRLCQAGLGGGGRRQATRRRRRCLRRRPQTPHPACTAGCWGWAMTQTHCIGASTGDALCQPLSAKNSRDTCWRGLDTLLRYGGA